MPAFRLDLLRKTYLWGGEITYRRLDLLRKTYLWGGEITYRFYVDIISLGLLEVIYLSSLGKVLSCHSAPSLSG